MMPSDVVRYALATWGASGGGGALAGAVDVLPQPSATVMLNNPMCRVFMAFLPRRAPVCVRTRGGCPLTHRLGGCRTPLLENFVRVVDLHGSTQLERRSPRHLERRSRDLPRF